MKNHKEIVIDENTHVRTLAWPIFIELLLNILLHNVDTIMLGRYSELAVGAVGNANQLLMVFLIMFNVVASATNVIVAQYLGAKQVDNAVSKLGDASGGTSLIENIPGFGYIEKWGSSQADKLASSVGGGTKSGYMGAAVAQTTPTWAVSASYSANDNSNMGSCW